MSKPATEPSAPLSPETTMAEVFAHDEAARPRLMSTLMQFHLGGCSLCGFEEQDAIDRVARDNGIPTARLLAALSTALDPAENSAD